MNFRLSSLLCALLALSLIQIVSASEATVTPSMTPVIDLSAESWGSGESFRLDGEWHAFWGQLYTPSEIKTTTSQAIEFKVPAVWGDESDAKKRLPALGYMTYHVKVRVPKDVDPLYLYLPDMPSANKLWVNGKFMTGNGIIGKTQAFEEPDFLPKVLQMPEQHNGELELVLQLSNYHYREGGVWYSLRLTDDSGLFAMSQRPVLFAVLFSTILIVIGVYNLSMFAFRAKEVAALYFGWLCLVVGFRRLLIDERVIYMFDLFSWTTLQRLEHLCFYLALPLFVGFFCSMYRTHIPKWTIRTSWVSVSPFLLLCFVYPARIYTEFNVMFQMLVVVSMIYACCLYIKIVIEKGKNIKFFGISLLLMVLTVIHDILKSNSLIPTTDNIAHFGVLAFVVTQSISLQRYYLMNLNLVEAMSAQLKNRNQELVEMDEFKDEFLATTSHELRTPLQGVSGLAKILKEEDHGSLTEEQHHKIGLIASTTQRLSVLVNDILDFSSIKHGKLKLNKNRVDLNAIAEVVLATMSPIIGKKEVILTAEISPEARYLNADEFRLQQVLFNLMGNATKYTEKGFIKLSAYLEKDELWIEISDSGLGIPDEKRDSLFHPFETVHVKGHYAASGAGLGLSISRQLVELHGGSLNLKSEVGQGTTVSIKFPSNMIVINDSFEKTPKSVSSTIYVTPTLSVINEQKKIETIKNPQDEEIHEGPLIFVVDDETVNSELVSSQLQSEGYQIEVFESGLLVLARLSEKLPDLILLDYMMPGMTGLEVCQVIRKQYDSYELPVMMLTARLQISDIVNALSVGANDYLIKPYHAKELIARVNTQINVRKYWIANRENQKLKDEIERREGLEDELSELNARLLNVLDISTELIILMNDQLQVIYANEKANKALSSLNQGLLGVSILELVNDELGETLKRLIKDQPAEVFSMNTAGISPGSNWNASVKSYYEYDKAYLALVITPALEASLPELPKNAAIASITLELNESRKKIDEIEGVLRQVISEPEPESESVETSVTDCESDPSNSGSFSAIEVGKSLSSLGSHKEELVILLRTSLNFWERHTSQGKVELAERSRCWRVYVDGTTVKTRTFDKYLNSRSVPDRPRWRAVVRTANYVLASCDLTKEEQLDLTVLIQTIENYYA
ncbi:MAG: signal transduction histidine kinase/FixJ family two-component response regulator [Oleiphilaceae bacterium]|jgi:signal transduction histidine kinase/FixJ family two-component response regulator